MFGRETRAVADRAEHQAMQARLEAWANVTPQHRHHLAILSNYHEAVDAAQQAKAVLDHAEQVCAQAAVALVEAKKQMQRVANGTI